MKRKLLAIVLTALIFCVTCCVFAGCKEDYPSNYTPEEHIERIKEKVPNYYKDKTEFYSWEEKMPDFEVYPLYNENDELTNFIVEFSSNLFWFIEMKVESKGPFAINGGMYLVDPQYEKWQRYRVGIDGELPAPYEGRQWQQKPDSAPYKGCTNYYEVDNEGQFIEYTHSPFYVAGVLSEKLYHIKTYSAYYIPAVKRGDKFINLISMEEFEYKDIEHYSDIMKSNDSSVPCYCVSYIASEFL